MVVRNQVVSGHAPSVRRYIRPGLSGEIDNSPFPLFDLSKRPIMLLDDLMHRAHIVLLVYMFFFLESLTPRFFVQDVRQEKKVSDSPNVLAMRLDSPSTSSHFAIPGAPVFRALGKNVLNGVFGSRLPDLSPDLLV